MKKIFLSLTFILFLPSFSLADSPAVGGIIGSYLMGQIRKADNTNNNLNNFSPPKPVFDSKLGELKTSKKATVDIYILVPRSDAQGAKTYISNLINDPDFRDTDFRVRGFYYIENLPPGQVGISVPVGGREVFLGGPGADHDFLLLIDNGKTKEIRYFDLPRQKILIGDTLKLIRNIYDTRRYMIQVLQLRFPDYFTLGDPTSNKETPLTDNPYLIKQSYEKIGDVVSAPSFRGRRRNPQTGKMQYIEIPTSRGLEGNLEQDWQKNSFTKEEAKKIADQLVVIRNNLQVIKDLLNHTTYKYVPDEYFKDDSTAKMKGRIKEMRGQYNPNTNIDNQIKKLNEQIERYKQYAQ